MAGRALCIKHDMLLVLQNQATGQIRGQTEGSHRPFPGGAEVCTQTSALINSPKHCTQSRSLVRAEEDFPFRLGHINTLKHKIKLAVY